MSGPEDARLAECDRAMPCAEHGYYCPARSAESLAPLLPQIEGLEPLRRVEDLLTDEQKAKLRDDLAEMARLRRRAAAESANIVMGGGA